MRASLVAIVVLGVAVCGLLGAGVAQADPGLVPPKQPLLKQLESQK
jgi:hypothetical protein